MSGSQHFHSTVVVAVVAVGVVQVTIHQIVDMVAVGDGFVTTVWPMDMLRVVTATTVGRRACGRVGTRDGDRMLIDVIIVGMVQVPVMKVVDMTIVDNGLMAAVRTVNVRVCFVDLAISHG